MGNHINTNFIEYIKESKSISCVAYHGGPDRLTNDTLSDAPIFFTPDIEGAQWYASNYPGGYVTKANINIGIALTCKNVEEFKYLWIPILDDAKVEYEFEESVDGWSFECEFIDNYASCMYDLVHMPEFVTSALKFGYDGISEFDVLGNYEIPIYIPFRRQSVNIESVKYVDIE
jgi:hypothetical protein